MMRGTSLESSSLKVLTAVENSISTRKSRAAAAPKSTSTSLESGGRKVCMAVVNAVLRILTNGENELVSSKISLLT